MKEKEARRAAREAKRRKEEETDEEEEEEKEKEESPATEIAEEPIPEKFVILLKISVLLFSFNLLLENEVYHLLKRKRRRKNKDHLQNLSMMILQRL
jgi:hypothetical protein